MQGFGHWLNSRFMALFLTSIVFGSLHLANPEITALGYEFIFLYITVGFVLGIMTLMDDGLELAIGFHAANNLFAALLVTADWTVFQTESILISLRQKQSQFNEQLRELENKKSISDLDARAISENITNIRLEQKTYEINLNNIMAYNIMHIHTDMYHDRWLLRYTTQLFKRQWGENLKKFEGMQLPGGVQFNGQTIWSESEEEIKRLEEEIISKFSMPVMDMIG